MVRDNTVRTVQNLLFMESQNGVGWKGSQSSSNSTPCHGQEHLPLDQVAPRPVQPILGHFQDWASHSFSEVGLTTLKGKNFLIVFLS